MLGPTSRVPDLFIVPATYRDTVGFLRNGAYLVGNSVIGTSDADAGNPSNALAVLSEFG